MVSELDNRPLSLPRQHVEKKHSTRQELLQEIDSLRCENDALRLRVQQLEEQLGVESAPPLGDSSGAQPAATSKDEPPKVLPRGLSMPSVRQPPNEQDARETHPDELFQAMDDAAGSSGSSSGAPRRKGLRVLNQALLDVVFGSSDAALVLNCIEISAPQQPATPQPSPPLAREQRPQQQQQEQQRAECRDAEGPRDVYAEVQPTARYSSNHDETAAEQQQQQQQQAPPPPSEPPLQAPQRDQAPTVDGPCHVDPDLGNVKIHPVWVNTSALQRIAARDIEHGKQRLGALLQSNLSMRRHIGRVVRDFSMNQAQAVRFWHVFYYKDRPSEFGQFCVLPCYYDDGTTVHRALLYYMNMRTGDAQRMEVLLRDHMSYKYVPCKVSLVDDDGHVLAQNSASIAAFGFRARDNMQDNCYSDSSFNYIRELFQDDPAAEIEMRERTAQAVSFSKRLRITSELFKGWLGVSGEVWHDVQISRLRDPADMKIAYIIVQTDVTAVAVAEQKLHEMQQRQETLLREMLPQQVINHLLTRLGDRAGPQLLHQLPTGPAGHLCLSTHDVQELATYHGQVSILFADIKGFTAMCQDVHPKRVMYMLNTLYSLFDGLLEEYDVYKVETVGDAYMVAAGLKGTGSRCNGQAVGAELASSDDEHAKRLLGFARAILRVSRLVYTPRGEPLEIRVGLHSGPCMSGVVGQRVPRFCLFGDTVNTASRLESTGLVNQIHVSQAFHALVPDEPWQPTTGVELKGKGKLKTYLLNPDGVPHTATEAAAAPAAATPAAAAPAAAAADTVEGKGAVAANDPAASVDAAAAAAAAAEAATAPRDTELAAAAAASCHTGIYSMFAAPATQAAALPRASSGVLLHRASSNTDSPQGSCEASFMDEDATAIVARLDSATSCFARLGSGVLPAVELLLPTSPSRAASQLQLPNPFNPQDASCSIGEDTWMVYCGECGAMQHVAPPPRRRRSSLRPVPLSNIERAPSGGYSGYSRPRRDSGSGAGSDVLGYVGRRDSADSQLSRGHTEEARDVQLKAAGSRDSGKLITAAVGGGGLTRAFGASGTPFASAVAPAAVAAIGAAAVRGQKTVAGGNGCGDRSQRDSACLAAASLLDPGVMESLQMLQSSGELQQLAAELTSDVASAHDVSISKVPYTPDVSNSKLPVASAPGRLPSVPAKSAVG